VFGVEAQGDWADLSRTRVSVIDPTLSTTSKADAFGLFTGQTGYAWNNVLWYVKGGAAVTSNRFTTFDALPGVGLASLSTTRWGGALGTGIEVGFAPNWSVGVEYDHLFMGSNNVNNSFLVVTPLVAGVNRIKEDVDLFTVRLNYRFGGYGAPPIAAGW
jgi:outer membrane immunogenic protein